MIRLSASKLETFWREEKESCRRRWWFKYPRRLPVAYSGSAGFGDVLHAVLERYLKADERGMDPETGAPVVLYPPGWDTPVDRITGAFGDTLSPADAALVKRLVAKAIAESLLYRAPNRLIEVPFEVHWPDHGGVRLKGAIDMVVLPDMVWDHKTHKSMSYARSKPRLVTSPQMLSYALALLKAQEENGVKLDGVHLKHLVFAKEEERVRETTGYVSRDQILEFEGKLIGRAGEMKAYEEIKDVNEWEKIPGPEPKSRACIAFGGCKFASICAGVRNGGETPAEYVARYEASHLLT